MKKIDEIILTLIFGTLLFLLSPPLFFIIIFTCIVLWILDKIGIDITDE